SLEARSWLKLGARVPTSASASRSASVACGWIAHGRPSSSQCRENTSALELLRQADESEQRRLCPRVGRDLVDHPLDARDLRDPRVLLLERGAQLLAALAAL